ncbi:MAG: DNA-processing protein DprA [Solirubrobacteraceae bacterium]
MFDSQSPVRLRERAAVLALMARGSSPWSRLAGAIEEEGSAARLLERQDSGGKLFEVEGKRITLEDMEEYVARLGSEDIGVVTVLDREYPVNLRMVHDRPAALFVRGELSEQDERSVAVVGTRKPSRHGVDLAQAVVAALLEGEFVIVSGLAAGIDTAAHRVALNAGARTVGVIGTGLRHAFPKANAGLQEQLATSSAVISQFWPGQEPRRWTFPQRNAVMSGFSRATVVIEASEVSGARIQARFAREHGRPVFLFESLLEHEWARTAAEQPGAYVVDNGQQITDHLERLYPSKLKLVS